MQFFIAAAALLGLASAAKVTDATLRDNNGLQSAELSIDGVKCSATSAAALGARQIACPGSAFSWHVDGSASDYQVTLFKGTNTGDPQASAKLPVDCRAGGAGQNDQVCTQVGDATVDI
ncbi:major allergen alt [Diplodia corticola]|uniref:Major allergen alt n=1 Tax=Diplodia corticola TaxID=236234 RepID=A0A1J9RRE9_9PEZI|nr:major allergen alt [Diplodia corticola]OJD30476.1 major allergen alt [Diplodia corticola]